MSFLTIRLAQYLGLDGDSSHRVQTLHLGKIPRLGGVAIFGTFVCMSLVLAVRIPDARAGLWLLTLVPVFAVGLAEDLSSRLSIRVRLAVTMLAASVGVQLLGAEIFRVDIGAVDHALASSAVLALAFTVFAGAGIPHAINLIDGCNGLASLASIMAFAGLALVAHWEQDVQVEALACVGCGSVLGFLVWNFPFGRIFLGDSGAYFIGFYLAELSISLVARHPDVSAWFPVMLLAYPIFETLFSSYRRATRKLGSAMQADARHLHHLIYRRLAKPLLNSRGVERQVLANSLSTLPLAAISAVNVALGLACYHKAHWLMALCAAFAVSYVLVYRRLAWHRPLRASGIRDSVAEAFEPASK